MGRITHPASSSCGRRAEPMRLPLLRLCCPLIVVTSIGVATPAAAQDPAQAGGAPSPPQTTPAQTTPASTGPLAEENRSLFAPSWNTFQLAGRLSSISGDEARYQRYQDLRNGLLFTGGRLLRGTSDWNLQAGADNVGWRDQHYFANYEQFGRIKISGLWDEIPQFYSIDTRTPFSNAGEGVLTLPDDAQLQKNLNAFLGISPQFDLRERRDIGSVRASATPTTQVDITGGFTTTRHSGELPWGSSFGFSNDNEVALPYRSRTNDVDLGAQWTNNRAMVRAAYN